MHTPPKLGQLKTSLADLKGKLQLLSNKLGTLKTGPAHATPTHPHDIYITLVSGYIEAQAFKDPAHAAVVTAANEPLGGGGGVDAAIWAAAGTRPEPEPINLRQACDRLPRGSYCPTGEARITSGILLDPIRIIHAVGPSVPSTSPNLLKNAYVNSLIVASQNNLIAIAFPPISIGIFGYPKKLGIHEAVEAVFDYLRDHGHNTTLREIRFVVWKQSQTGTPKTPATTDDYFFHDSYLTNLTNMVTIARATEDTHGGEETVGSARTNIIDVTTIESEAPDIKNALGKANPRVNPPPTKPSYKKPRIFAQIGVNPPKTLASWERWENEASWRVFKYIPTR